MIRKQDSRFMAVVIVLLLLLTAAPVLAQRDRTPPTKPTNLRVTAKTAYSVTLTWNASTDNSGQFSYIICCAYNNMATVPHPATSFTFTAGLEAGRTFTFRIYAKDAAGNSSGYSNSVTVTLPNDTQPPSKPVVQVTEVGPTHVKLQLSSNDNGPHVWYTIFQNGIPIINQSSNATPIITPLTPGTSYIYTVQARDFAALLSPLSDPVPVTTASANPNDNTPPTMPSNLRASNWDEEVELTWGQSTDNVTPQSLIQYEVYVNGVLDHIIVGRGRTIVYGTAGIVNVFEVIAVDAAGNASASASTTVDLS